MVTHRDDLTPSGCDQWHRPGEAKVKCNLHWDKVAVRTVRSHTAARMTGQARYEPVIGGYKLCLDNSGALYFSDSNSGRVIQKQAVMFRYPAVICKKKDLL